VLLAKFVTQLSPLTNEEENFLLFSTIQRAFFFFLLIRWFVLSFFWIFFPCKACSCHFCPPHPNLPTLLITTKPPILSPISLRLLLLIFFPHLSIGIFGSLFLPYHTPILASTIQLASSEELLRHTPQYKTFFRLPPPFSSSCSDERAFQAFFHILPGTFWMTSPPPKTTRTI